MSQWKVDPETGARVRENGSFVRVEGEEEIAQHGRIRLRLFRGETPLNLDLGMDYVGLILAKGTPEQLIEGEYRSQLLETPGFVEVTRLDLDQTDVQRATREGEIDFDALISVDDLSERIPLHDQFTVPTQGGS